MEMGGAVFTLSSSAGIHPFIDRPPGGASSRPLVARCEIGATTIDGRRAFIENLTMPQVWIDIEDNDNCGYFPMQTFEARGVERVASSVVLESVTNVEGRCEIVGWSDEGRCDVRVIQVGDSGAGESILVYGDNHGIRLRPSNSEGEWMLGAPHEFGEPYMLLPAGTVVEFIGLRPD